MQIEIAESVQRREISTYLTPTRLARKLAVSHATVTKSLKESNTPFITAQNPMNTLPERRIHADDLLGLIGHITQSHPGAFPDLEHTVFVKNTITLIVDPGERPHNMNRLRHGRRYAQRRVTFIQ